MNRSDHYETTFIELYNQYSDDIFRFCFARLRDREKALDATQDTFFKMWNEYAKNPQKFSEIQHLRAFLYRVARNTIIDLTRKKTTTPFSFLTNKSSDDEASSSIEPVEIAHTDLNPEEHHQASELFEQLDHLDNHHREILIMRFINDMTIPDIADILDISENATSVRIHRALEHARIKLEHLYE